MIGWSCRSPEHDVHEPLIVTTYACSSPSIRRCNTLGCVRSGEGTHEVTGLECGIAVGEDQRPGVPPPRSSFLLVRCIANRRVGRTGASVYRQLDWHGIAGDLREAISVHRQGTTVPGDQSAGGHDPTASSASTQSVDGRALSAPPVAVLIGVRLAARRPTTGW